MSTKKNSEPTLKIGVDERGKKLFIMEVETKIECFKALKKYAESFDLDVDLAKLYYAPKKTILEAFDKSTNEGVLSKIKVEKKADLFDLSIDLVSELEKSFLSLDAEFFPETLDFMLPDFDIVITGKENIAKYKATENMLDAIKEYEKHYHSVKPMDVVRMCQGAVTFDPSTMELKPTINIR